MRKTHRPTDRQISRQIQIDTDRYLDYIIRNKIISNSMFKDRNACISYASSLPATCQRWRSHHSIRHILKPHARRKRHGSMFYRTGVVADRSFTLHM